MKEFIIYTNAQYNPETKNGASSIIVLDAGETAVLYGRAKALHWENPEKKNYAPVHHWGALIAAVQNAPDESHIIIKTPDNICAGFIDGTINPQANREYAELFCEEVRKKKLRVASVKVAGYESVVRKGLTPDWRSEMAYNLGQDAILSMLTTGKQIVEIGSKGAL